MYATPVCKGVCVCVSVWLHPFCDLYIYKQENDGAAIYEDLIPSARQR